MLEKVKCPICVTDNTKRIRAFKFQDLKSNLVLCKNCGLGYLNPRWSKNDYSNYYENLYDIQFRPELISKNSNAFTNEKNIILERFKRSKTSIVNAKSILDIGSGAGDNLLAFRNENPQLVCYAIEPSKVSQGYLKERNINIVSDDVDKNWESGYNKKFDIVIMRHVLEHFLDPVNVLNKVNTVLADNGVLYLAVPNNLIKKRSKDWLRVAHTCYFNQFTIRAVLKKAMLRICTLRLEDEFNKFEIFAFVEKSIIINDFDEIKNSYKKQKNVFQSVFRNEKNQGKIKMQIKRVLLKLIYGEKNKISRS